MNRIENIVVNQNVKLQMEHVPHQVAFDYHFLVEQSQSNFLLWMRYAEYLDLIPLGIHGRVYETMGIHE